MDGWIRGRILALFEKDVAHLLITARIFIVEHIKAVQALDIFFANEILKGGGWGTKWHTSSRLRGAEKYQL